MKIISTIITLSLITGCASTKVVNHDFNSVVEHLESKYKTQFSVIEENRVYPAIGNENSGLEQAVGLGITWLLCGKEVEVKKYEENKKLKLNLTSEFVGKTTDKITLTPENENQTKIKVKHKESFLIFVSRDKERESKIIKDLEDELNGISQPKEMMTESELGNSMLEGFLTGLVDLSTNQNESTTRALTLP